MPSRSIDRRIDDALLATATWAGFLWVRRRVRRIFSRVALAAAGAVGLGGAVTVGVLTWAWKRRSATPPA